MKYNFETKYLTASTDSTVAAKRLILLIEDMEKLEEEKYAHDEHGNRIPVMRAKPTEDFVDYCVKRQAEQPFKGAIVVDELEKPIFNPEEITGKISKEPFGDMGKVIHDGGNCVETDKGFVIMKKPRKTKKPIEFEEYKPKKPKIINTEDVKPAQESLENAYMGEHLCIQPKEKERKHLSPKENLMWVYISTHKDYTIHSTTRDLGITKDMYYFLKSQLKKKGYPVNGAVDWPKAED